MIKLYREIQEEIDSHFKLYINDLFATSGEARKYYYWSVEFFINAGGLSFRHYDLDVKQKDKINALGNSYFGNSEIQFSINKNSHRNDLSIKNIAKLFPEKDKSGQMEKYEYIKEFILWQLIDELKDDEGLSEAKELQEQNFIITYISYLCSEHTKPIHAVLKENYINYNITSQGQELEKKLSDLADNDNSVLVKKIERLYILKKEESKIHFVFSREGGGEKEELRELLEVMGKEETGKLYRGQANSAWGLDSSMTRQPKYLAYEAEMYYEILSLKPDAFQNDSTIYERLITMQHFGMPTRLLDITRNPLVAIFFACNNFECKDNDGVIFTFSPSNKADFLNFEDDRLANNLPALFNHNSNENTPNTDNFLSKIWFIKGIAKNQRINNQSGDFIFVGKGKQVKEELHQLPKMAIVIDFETKKILLEQLESLNIHGGAVYPDLTHMSNYISNKYLHDKKSVSITELVNNVVADKKEEVAKPVITKQSASEKAVKKQTKEESFDFVAIKNKARTEQLSSFSDFYQVEEQGLNKIVEDFLFTEKKPFRDEVIKIMHNKPPLKNRAEVIGSLTDKIITLAKIISKE
ncbi:FRG domain-containing protein [Pseudoalteromonas sp. SWYJ118]|uniref:FRG domain-containing protein n=1 Tax=Pseudoalteromonas sp. SWYJ118 TaxID=2792062 RepID=UPI0018CDEF0D|nr:FRG domain-containing protein [Pseudoalteromonas sp. SWYJ118]MBH0076024.1 FRG domain-containing protein [Pseudoalteromonas sp. SWYJ118]